MRIRLLSVLLTILSIHLAAAQDVHWDASNGPYGGSVRVCVLASDGIPYAGSEGTGMFRGTLQHGGWVRCGLATEHIRFLAVDSSGGVIAATSAAVFRSTDCGEIWSTITPPETGMKVRTLGVSPDGWIVVGTQTRIWWSADSGTGWIGWGRPASTVQAVAFTSQGTWIAGSGQAILRSTNKGVTWSKTDSAFTAEVLHGGMPGVVLAGTADRGVYRSTDDGITWTQEGLRGAHTVTSFVRVPPNEFFAGVQPLDPSIPGGVWRSTDLGTTWSAWGLQHRTVRTLTGDGAGGLIAGLPLGIWHSSDAGQTWSAFNTGLTILTVTALLAPSTSEVLAATNAGMFYSSDQGQQWQPCVPDLTIGTVDAVASDRSGRLFFSSMLFTPIGGIFRSDDHGATWTKIGGDVITGMYQNVKGLVVGPHEYLFAGTNGRIYRSKDHGDSWERVDTLRNDPKKASGVGAIYAMAADSAGRIFVATWGKGAYRSTNGGDAWEKADSGIVNKNLSCLAAKDSTAMYAGGAGGLCRSTDAGQLWTPLITGASGQVQSVSVTSQGDILASIAGRVFKSTDDGDTWVEVTGVLPVSQTRVLAVSPDATTYAGGDTGGVYVSRDAALAVPAIVAGVASRVGLSRNYPNPFNPSTTLRYSLPFRTHVTITVHTILGQTVAVLVDDERMAGDHDVQFKADALASGVYLCRLRAGEYVLVRTMLLLR